MPGVVVTNDQLELLEELSRDTGERRFELSQGYTAMVVTRTSRYVYWVDVDGHVTHIEEVSACVECGEPCTGALCGRCRGLSMLNANEDPAGMDTSDGLGA